MSTTKSQEHESVHYGKAHPAPAPDDTQLADDDPNIWGWHHTMTKLARGFGWVMSLALLSMVIGNHQGHVEDVWVVLVAAIMIGMLIRDKIKRSKGWRE